MSAAALVLGGHWLRMPCPSRCCQAHVAAGATVRSCPSFMGSEGDQVAQGIIQGSWKNFFRGCSTLCIHSGKRGAPSRKDEKLVPPYRWFLDLEKERGVSRKAHIPHQLPICLLWQVLRITLGTASLVLVMALARLGCSSPDARKGRSFHFSDAATRSKLPQPGNPSG